MKSASELDRNICTGSTGAVGGIIVVVLLLSVNVVGLGGGCNDDAKYTEKG